MNTISSYHPDHQMADGDDGCLVDSFPFLRSFYKYFPSPKWDLGTVLDSSGK